MVCGGLNFPGEVWISKKEKHWIIPIYGIKFGADAKYGHIVFVLELLSNLDNNSYTSS